MEYLLSVYKNESLFFSTQVFRRRDAFRVWTALKDRFNAKDKYEVRLEVVIKNVQPAEFILDQETGELKLDYSIELL